MSQFGRPDSDVTKGAWTASSGTDLYPMLDEVSPDSADYIILTNQTSNTCEVGLTNVTDPVSSSNHVVRVRGRRVGTVTLTAYLYQGTTQICTFSLTLGTTDATTEYTLSGAEADAITDYSDLRIRLTGTASNAARFIYIVWAELDVPDVATATLTISVSDSITLSESIGRDLLLTPGVVESLTLTESVIAELSALQIDKSDLITVSETVDVHVRALWYHADEIAVVAGAIESGLIEDTWSDNGTQLVLTEITANPGFDYHFYFRDVPDSAYNLIFNGHYAGNPAHNVKIQQWNFNTSNWTDLTAASTDFPSDTVDYDDEFSIFGGTNYVSSGEVRLRIYHNGTGVATHRFYIDYLKMGQNESVHVADSFVLSENASVDVGIDVLGVDAVTLSEAIGVSLLVDIPVVTDAITLSENAIVDLALDVNLSDNFTIGEGVAAETSISIFVSDSITLVESVQVMTPLLASVSDGITFVDFPGYYSEHIDFVDIAKTELVSLIAVIETMTFSEAVSVDVSSPVVGDLSLSVSDAITLAESIAVNLGIEISVLDTLTLAEQLFVQLNIDLPTAIETVVLSEAVAVNLGIDTSVADAISFAEAVYVAMGIDISVLDLATFAEAVYAILGIDILVSDVATFAESVNVLIQVAGLHQITVNETVSLAETVYVSISDMVVSQADSFTVSEAVSVEAPRWISVSDNILLSESTLLDLSIALSATDTFTVADAVIARLGVDISVADSFALSEAILASVGISLSVSDSVIFSEIVSATIGDLEISVLDSTTLAELIVVLLGNLEISVQDAVTVSENVVVSPLDLSVNVFDSFIVSESFAVAVAIGYAIFVSDNFAVSESVNVQMDGLQISATDLVTVADTANINISYLALILAILYIKRNYLGTMFVQRNGWSETQYVTLVHNVTSELG